MYGSSDAIPRAAVVRPPRSRYNPAGPIISGVAEFAKLRRAVKKRQGVEARTKPRPPRHHHSVYVVLLARDVLYEPKFRKCNPDYDPTMPCVYVGMTGQSPDVRFDKHKAGLKSNKFVRRYGLRLLPELYECYNPMPYEAALDMEIELAIYLRDKGYGVWQG